jgi:hypothetical protein
VKAAFDDLVDRPRECGRSISSHRCSARASAGEW